MAAFHPCLSNGIMSFWDDRVYLDRPEIRSLGAASLRWMFSSGHAGQYVPLAWLSLAVDWRLWGPEAAGYHLTNVLLHAAAAAVWFLFWRRLFRRFVKAEASLDADLAAVFAALAFAIHPLRVESVAWLAERREMLCGLFYAGALLLYLESCLRERSREAWLGAALICHALSLLCKASSMTLPVTLLILDVYPLERSSRRSLLEKAPFFTLSAALAAVTSVTLSRGGLLQDFAQQDLWRRLARACYGFWLYAGKILWPTRLAPIYELPRPFDPFAPVFLLAMAAILLGAVAALRYGRRFPAASAAAAHYAATFLLISGLVSAGLPHLAFDRYSYYPSLAFCALGGAGLLKLLSRPRVRRQALGAATAFLLILGALSWRRCLVWRDDLSLWRSALPLSPGPVALDNLAAAEGARGNLGAAEDLARRSVGLDPTRPQAWENLAAALYKLGRSHEAEDALRRGSTLNPGSAELASRLDAVRKAAAEADVDAGNLLARRGRYGEAGRLYRRALKEDPGSKEARVNLDAVSRISR